jgi:hypothetical protein
MDEWSERSSATLARPEKEQAYRLPLNSGEDAFNSLPRKEESCGSA